MRRCSSTKRESKSVGVKGGGNERDATDGCGSDPLRKKEREIEVSTRMRNERGREDIDSQTKPR